MKTLLSICMLVMFTALPSKKMLQQDDLWDLTDRNGEFSFDIRYATADNFIGEPLYPCARCLLRPEVARALIAANQYFCEQGYQIRLYDCYRPYRVQKQMWEKVPKATYVANPYDGGSVHNRGAAVDLTLTTMEGCFVDMGTDYDYFGKESHIDFTGHPEYIQMNRKLLIEGMKRFGFEPIRTEWWHFGYQKNLQYPIMDIPLPCD